MSRSRRKFSQYGNRSEKPWKQDWHRRDRRVSKHRIHIDEDAPEIKDRINIGNVWSGADENKGYHNDVQPVWQTYPRKYMLDWPHDEERQKEIIKKGKRK